jgi:hypothetical protein
VFTPLTTSGVHAPSWNHMSWGVEIVGDYDNERVRPDVWENAIHAITTLHLAVGLDLEKLRFHKEDPLTDHKHCPGDRIVKADLVKAIQARLFVETAGEHLPDRAAPPSAPATSPVRGSPAAKPRVRARK